MADLNWAVTAPIPDVAIRRGLVDEVTRKVNALPMVIRHPREVLVNLDDVLNLLKEYQ